MHNSTIEMPDVEVICNEAGHACRTAKVLQLLVDVEASVVGQKQQCGRSHHARHNPFGVGLSTREFCRLVGNRDTLRLDGCTACRWSTGCQREEVKIQNTVQEVLIQTPKRCLRRDAVCVPPASGSPISRLVRTRGLRKVELREDVLVVFGEQECY